jgi:hypothetical protein
LGWELSGFNDKLQDERTEPAAGADELKVWLFGPPSKTEDLRDGETLTSLDVNIVQPEVCCGIGGVLIALDGDGRRPSSHLCDFENRKSTAVSRNSFDVVVVMAIDRHFVVSHSKPVWVDQTLRVASDYAPRVMKLGDHFCAFAGSNTLCP